MEKSSIPTGAIFWQQCAGNKQERKSPVKQSYETKTTVASLFKVQCYYQSRPVYYNL